MAFESLSCVYEVRLQDFPEKWLPLTILYDPDLPLFPIQYFHRLDPNLEQGRRPGEHDRIFGYIQRLNFDQGTLQATVITNKDLTDGRNIHFIPVVEEEVSHRLGHRDPVKLEDIQDAFDEPLAPVNALLKELWFKVVDPSFGKLLPFGRIWDEVFGLIRFIASWNSGGRKEELIQTHDFVRNFGARIATGNGIHVDFHLLPTFEEFRDQTNPLASFPKFSLLLKAAKHFAGECCSSKMVETQTFTTFSMPEWASKRKISNEFTNELVDKFPSQLRPSFRKNWGAFNRGPHRSIIALMMLHDLRAGNWEPASLDPHLCGLLYPELEGTYQSPKVIELYVQLSFGLTAAMPIDMWVKTFLAHPFDFHSSKKEFHKILFSSCDRLGKVERLIWVCSQARKVHSSVCSDTLWCVRFGEPKRGNKAAKMRGANPLACKICTSVVRDACPAFQSISSEAVQFNASERDAPFNIITSDGSNSKQGQSFVSCEAEKIHDEYSPQDEPQMFADYPNPTHKGVEITVLEFISTY